MPDRGRYGRTDIGTDLHGRQEPSFGMMLLGGVAVGVVALWAKHQSDQIAKLYATTGLPYQSFSRSLGARTRQLSDATREKFRGLSQHFGAHKELEDGK